MHELVDIDGLGADVTIEAVGFPEAVKLAADLIRSGGRIDNIGVHEGRRRRVGRSSGRNRVALHN